MRSHDHPAHDADPVPEGEQTLHRGLGNRHLQLIAIGGAIGTGLFMGSGKTISLAGPSILLVYAIIGAFLFFVMRAMGELLLSNLKYKSFRDIAEDILGPWAGFFAGWTYWFCWIVIGVADLTAVTAYVRFWWPDLPKWVAATVLVALLLGLNLIAVRLFGEIEFWFALIKIVAIVALIAVAIIMIVTGFVAPDGHQASLTNMVADGGFFPTGAGGFLAGFQIAFFAFLGIELVGTAAAETKDPVRTLPKAINAIPVRVMLFYICALAAIMAVTPWRSIDPEVSPFVSMFALAGLGAAASVVNFVVLTSASSSANAGIFSTSRMLFGLALDRMAPRAFGRLSKSRVPAKALVFSCTCLVPGIILLYTTDSIIAAFTLATTVASVLFIFVWGLIVVSYLVYRRRSPERHAASVYKMPVGIVACWAVLGFFAAMIAILALEPDTRQALLVTPLWFVVLGVAYWLRGRRLGAVVSAGPGSDGAPEVAPDPAGGPVAAGTATRGSADDATLDVVP
ncbi:D-serine/D-alanine/glycine transporter [Propionicicella superfundia]|uniref:D-serine/D-alanine/glycine transporter n=1 Tax=Propionicicella superfundia TaxID=348582 RepID=UPI00040F4C4C|nr:D-serine/D-alanine/glycine transporter [Propionicicella superfundia]